MKQVSSKVIGKMTVFMTVIFMFTARVYSQQGNTVPIPEMALIEKGHFTMGTPETETGSKSSERPQHGVTLDAFYMGRYEVSQKEYAAVMGFNPSANYAPDLPVDFVDWYDAIEYCNALSKIAGLTPVYTVDKTPGNPNFSENDKRQWNVTWDTKANGYRLPTEAEWEYACRGGTTSAYYTSAYHIDMGYFYFYANYDTRTIEPHLGFSLTPGTVMIGGSYPPNPFGLYDMMGNVYEWCWDWWSDNYTAGSLTNPTGPDRPQYSGDPRRVLRGGCYFTTIDTLRSGRRDNSPPAIRWKGNGIRVVRNRE
jgi:formylglycine-generating enzyme required for sulfatase activity